MELIESFKCETYIYNSIDEKVKHMGKMLRDGWEVDCESFEETISISVTYCKDILNS
jgi:hypothetical protein